jgi:hypothetical protein
MAFQTHDPLSCPTTEKEFLFNFDETKLKTIKTQNFVTKTTRTLRQITKTLQNFTKL